MDLSVIIVNYNVQHFVRQTLISVKKALSDIQAEVIIVDNASTDGSIPMLEREFSEFRLIKSEVNLGFSKANNIGINASVGEFVLLLNPDTIIQSDTLLKCLSFMRSTPDAGAIGVKMVDGSGHFLPESKRGFPSPKVAFYKAFGLSKLFPKSRIFNQYHLGHLTEDEIHEVDVLSGAFMFLRKSVLDKIGLLDEQFFMYGEDIDLSYRVTEAGYKNYYLPTTTIIHFKGESTKRGSLNYVKIFYRAMIIFSDKHFKGKKAWAFSWIMRLGIYVRAMMDVVGLIFSKTLLPILDLSIIFSGLWVFKNFWEVYYFKDAQYFDGSNIVYHLLIYSLVWVGTIYLYGGYAKKYKIQRIIQGMLLISLVQLAIYGMLNAHFRPSRMMLVMGTIWSMLVMIANRLVVQFSQFHNFEIGSNKEKRIIIVGGVDEIARTKTLIQQSIDDYNYIGGVYLNGDKQQAEFIQDLQHIVEIIDFFDVNEIIWCQGESLDVCEIITQMQRINRPVDHKIVPEEGLSIIGSESKETQGESYYGIKDYNLSDPVVLRLKRMWDFAWALIFLITFPLLVFYVKKPFGIFKNVFGVLGGKSWVGYFEDENSQLLPPIRKGIFTPASSDVNTTQKMKALKNKLYAKKYNILHDMRIIIENLRGLGN